LDSFRLTAGVESSDREEYIIMGDQKNSDPLTANTQKLPAVAAAAAASSSQKTAEAVSAISAKEDAHFQAEQVRVEKMIQDGAPLSDVLSNLILLIESQVPEMLGSILLLSDDGNHVKHAVAPSLPLNYIKVIDGAPIGPKNGSCGTAMWRGEPVIVTDIATDPLWDEYRNFAWAIGVAACWSTPIMSSKGKVLGSFAMYYREKRGPNEDEHYLTSVATRLAAKAIEAERSR
jgi:GAF domain-containing protein